MAFLRRRRWPNPYPISSTWYLDDKVSIRPSLVYMGIRAEGGKKAFLGTLSSTASVRSNSSVANSKTSMSVELVMAFSQHHPSPDGKNGTGGFLLPDGLVGSCTGGGWARKGSGT